MKKDAAKVGLATLLTLALVGIPAVGQEMLIRRDARLDDLAVNDAGVHLVTWQSTRGTLPGLRAHRFRSDGRPVGGEVDIDASGRFTTSVTAAIHADGDFVIAWLASPPDPQEGMTEVLVRRVGRGGKPRPSFQIASRVGYYIDDGRPFVAMNRAGGFLVAWERIANLTSTTATLDVFAQVFERAGNPIDDRFRVNTSLTDNQGRPVVAATEQEGFFVVWESFVPVVGRVDLVGRILSRRGDPLTAELPISTKGGTNTLADVACSLDGSCVVAWQGADAAVVETFARRFGADGAPLGDEILVNLGPVYRGDPPSVATSAAGEFFVAWTGAHPDGAGAGVFGQRFEASGARAGELLELDNDAQRVGSSPKVTMTPAGSVLVAWDCLEIEPHRWSIVARLLDGERDESGGADSDRDGISDALDNCPTVANADQTDAADDGHGDACVSADATIAPTARLGIGVLIGAGSRIEGGASVGDDVRIGEWTLIKRRVVVESGIRSAPSPSSFKTHA